MNYPINFECDEDGVWIVECPSVPGCVSQSHTKKAALENIEDTIRGCLEVRRKFGSSLLETV